MFGPLAHITCHFLVFSSSFLGVEMHRVHQHFPSARNLGHCIAVACRRLFDCNVCHESVHVDLLNQFIYSTTVPKGTEFPTGGEGGQGITACGHEGGDSDTSWPSRRVQKGVFKCKRMYLNVNVNVNVGNGASGTSWSPSSGALHGLLLLLD